MLDDAFGLLLGLFARSQPAHADMSQVFGQFRAQAAGVAARHFAKVFHHRFGGLQLTLHIVAGLAQQQRQPGQGHQPEQQADAEIDAAQSSHLLGHAT